MVLRENFVKNDDGFDKVDTEIYTQIWKQYYDPKFCAKNPLMIVLCSYSRFLNVG